MKKLSVSDLATILQMNQIIKENLIKEYPTLSETAQDEILRVLWDGVHELEGRLALLKHEKLLEEVEEGKRDLTDNLYEDAMKEVWNDFDKILSGTHLDEKLIETIRSELKPLQNQLQTVQS